MVFSTMNKETISLALMSLSSVRWRMSYRPFQVEPLKVLRGCGDLFSAWWGSWTEKNLLQVTWELFR
jgi:hypothetical protein